VGVCGEKDEFGAKPKAEGSRKTDFESEEVFGTRWGGWGVREKKNSMKVAASAKGWVKRERMKRGGSIEKQSKNGSRSATSFSHSEKKERGKGIREKGKNNG